MSEAMTSCVYGHCVSYEKQVLRAQELQIQGFTEEQITYKVFKNIECEGSKTILMILKPEDGDFLSAFVQRHRQEFNFTL
ncbi:hypothetical protein GGP41_009691 [Bipolaris sorokiniana]|uniref:Uncharacterized protein n=1 Tax=Cochliobolus sativus TaxID=45130 RepID=A0A8H6DUN6_COCSA|nr:hypothetical protein GGP41_009691 [Bipolaris sorokiniana]